MENSLEHYVSLPYTVSLKPYADGGYFAKVEELPGCMTEGDSLDEALEMIENAKRAWISTALEDGHPILRPSDEVDEYSGKLVVRMPKTLHRTLADQARAEGISLNQLILYHLARGTGPQQQPPHL